MVNTDSKSLEVLLVIDNMSKLKYVFDKLIMSKIYRDVYAFKSENFLKIWAEIFQLHAEKVL